VRLEIFHAEGRADRQTDRQTERGGERTNMTVRSRFRNFAKVPEN